MASLYLLDTNILSHLVRQPQGPIAEHIADVGEANVATIKPLESNVERIYATIRAALEKRGTVDAICVTDNVAEFKRVPALKVENWLR